MKSELDSPSIQVKNYLAGFGVVVIFFGLIILYMVFYGNNVVYTHTYQYLAKIIPPLLNLDILVITLAMAFQLWFFVLFAPTKLKFAETIYSHKKLRWAIGIMGSLLFLAMIILFSMGLFFGNQAAIFTISKLESLSFYLLPGFFGVLLLMFSAFPDFLSLLHELKQKIAYRLIAFVLALVLSVMAISLIELSVMDPPDKQILSSQSNPENNNAPITHYLYFTVSPHYRKLRAGESVPLELVFKAFDASLQNNGSVGAYPIALNPTHEYAVKINLRSVGFDVQSPSVELLEPRPIIANEAMKWLWVISPEKGSEGLDQTLVFEAYIYDLTNNHVLIDSPYTTVTVSISTPLGLPTWLLSPQTGIGTIFGGAIALIVPKVLEEITSFRKKTQEKKKRKTK